MTRGLRGFRERLVLTVGICDAIYQSALAIAPSFVSPAIPALRMVFFIAFFLAAVASLSLLKSAFTPPPGSCEVPPMDPD
jgi:hypothetical protein